MMTPQNHREDTETQSPCRRTASVSPRPAECACRGGLWNSVSLWCGQALNERGVALGAVIMTAVVFSVAAVAALTMVLSRANLLKFADESRLRARFAAEAGLVWAAQQLFEDPDILTDASKCFTGNSNPDFCDPPAVDADFCVDTDGNGKPETKVDIVANPCPVSGTVETTLKAKVTIPSPST